jgi:hypothetical protein
MEASEDEHDNFILITSDSPYKITDATEQFQNKYIFYSPSIIASIDVSLPMPQDVFIYNKGRTIDPADIFQQTTRTRNINKLYYYSEVKTHLPIYESLDECRTINQNLTTTSKEIFEVCSSNNNMDDEIINENTFFDMYIYSEYVADIFNTNKTVHYEKILKEEGFILSSVGTVQKLDKVIQNEMKERVENIKDETFNDFIETGSCSENLQSNLELLGFDSNTDKDILLKYKPELTDKLKLTEHLNIIRCLKDYLTINVKIAKVEDASYSIQCLNSIYHKISIVRQLAKDMNIQFLDVNVSLNDIKLNTINDKKWLLMCKMFRLNRKAPTTKGDIFKLYISLLKHIMTSDIIITKQNTKMVNKSRGYIYKLNKDAIIHHIELDKYTNRNLINYDETILKGLNIEKPKQCKLIENVETLDDDPFVDSDDESDENCQEYQQQNTYIQSILDYGLDENDI